MNYYSSDSHYFHNNIIEYCNRPFDSALEMNEALIENHNRAVGVNDDLYCCGDFAFGGFDKIKSIRGRLNGRIHLILGNHDHARKIDKYSEIFDSVSYYKEVNDNEEKICLFHYPMLTWNNCHRGSYAFVGHAHNTQPQTAWLNNETRQFDVGVDAIAAWLAHKNNTELLPEYYRPTNLKEIMDYEKKTTNKID